MHAPVTTLTSTERGGTTNAFAIGVPQACSAAFLC
jgi:hypothetical protein